MMKILAALTVLVELGIPGGRSVEYNVPPSRK
jgi:hypothetical protein